MTELRSAIETYWAERELKFRDTHPETTLEQCKQSLAVLKRLLPLNDHEHRLAMQVVSQKLEKIVVIEIPARQFTILLDRYGLVARTASQSERAFLCEDFLLTSGLYDLCNLITEEDINNIVVRTTSSIIQLMREAE